MSADEQAAAALLRSRGWSVTRARQQDTQRLWLCTWGTMTALVWAQTAENAERRVRHGCFDRRASLHQVEAQAVVVTGDVLIREATAADLARFEECGGRLPA